MMVQKEETVLIQMQKRLAKMSRSHKTIALYILDHYDQAVFMTAAQLGGELGISESTVVRFAAALSERTGKMREGKAEFCTKRGRRTGRNRSA